MRVVRLRQPAVILLWLVLAVSGGAKLASELCSTPYVYFVLSVQSGHGINLASHVLHPLHMKPFTLKRCSATGNSGLVKRQVNGRCSCCQSRSPPGTPQDVGGPSADQPAAAQAHIAHLSHESESHELNGACSQPTSSFDIAPLVLRKQICCY